MYKNEELLEQEKKFARVHFKGLIVILLYLVVDVFRNFSVGTPFFFRTATISMILILEQILRPFDFFKNPKIIFVMKYFQILLMAVFIMYSGCRNYEYAVYIIFYIGIILELSAFFDLTEGGKVLLYMVLSFLPLVISGGIYVIIDRTLEYILSVMSISCCMGLLAYTVANHLGERYRYFERAVFAKDRMIDKAMDANKEIMDKQDKLFYVNEQLGIKRIEIEAANRKINANNLEINIQNDLLRFFNSTHDIDKIIRFFSTKLVEEMKVKFAGMLKAEDPEVKGVFEDYKRSNPSFDAESEFRMYGDVSKELCHDMAEAFVNPEFLDMLVDEMYVCRNVKRSSYSFLAAEHVGSFAAKAVYIDERRAGIYIICHGETDFFAEKEKYFDNILYQLQVAANNAFLYSRFEDMAKKDGLTGLYNRRILNQVMEKYRHPDEEIKKERIVAAMFDIDNFKSINDTYGHLFGDVAIISVSDTIQNVALKYGGTGYRYGGEEFVVLFHEKNLSEVLPVVEEIHRAIRETEVSMGDISLYINTSAGVSAYPEISVSQMTVIDNADKAMYKSKTTGKGRITVDAREAQ